MKTEYSMYTTNLPLTIALTSAASVTTFVVVVWLCACCYKQQKDEDEYDNLEPVAEYKPMKNERDDVKKLHKHSWIDPSANNSPLLTRKTIKFERPPGDKRFVTEQVQPDSYTHTTINERLGVRNQNHSASASPSLASNNVSTARLQGTGEGSANNSPFHRVLHTTAAAEADATGGAAGEDPLPIPIEEPEYVPGGEKLGRIQFHLSYDFHEMTLTLKIIRAVELAAKDFSGTSDPYVKIMLLPDKKHKLQTNIKRRNLNPRWNEVFAFEGFPYSRLMNRTLYLQVLDYDRFSRDDPIGEICLPLSEVDLAQGQTLWRTLQPCKGHTGKLGELLLSLCYQPTVGRITVVVMKARELKAKDINGLSDPYVKIWLNHEGKKVEKKKTSIKEKNLNPVFNESFIFNVPYEKIRQTTLHISVMDYDRMGRNELIGQIVLGTKSGSMEVKHWNEMFAKSRQPVAQWHILKDFG